MTAPQEPRNDPPRCLANTLDHLPEHKRRALERITHHICQIVPLDWVVLFGSYARGDWVEDPINQYFSDYDLLVVVSDPWFVNRAGLWQRIEENLEAIAGRIPVSLLVHTIKEVNHEIRTGHYFFCDIINEGVVLHNGHRSLFAKVNNHTPEERLDNALYNFDYWFNSANDFWQGCGYYMAQGKNAPAAFMLHQSVERYYHATTLVFTGYKRKCHNISTLAKEGAELHEALIAAMPREEEPDKSRFDLLRRAYIDARYSKSYRISEEELTALRGHVHDLAERVLHACGEKLASFRGPEAVGELPTPPEEGEDAEPPPLPPLEDRAALERWSRRVMREREERGLARGREEGLAEGLERGLEQGIEQGIEQGARRQALQIARTLLEKGTPPQEVESITGLTTGEVEALVES